MAMVLAVSYLPSVPSQANPGEMPWVQVAKEKN